MRVGAFTAIASLTLVGARSTAQAQEVSAADRTAAAEAYDNGTRRFLQHDYAGAANWFETADRMAPSALALTNAMRAHQQAGGPEHFARAATLATRIAALYPTDTQAQRLAHRTLEQVGPQVGHVTINCGQCQIEADGTMQQGSDFFVTPGAHALIGHWPGGRANNASVEVAAGQTQAVEIREPAQHTVAVATSSSAPAGSSPIAVIQPHQDIAPSRGGLHPALFISGLVATAAIGGVAVWSWLDATRQGTALIQNAMTTHTRDLAMEQAVQSAELRTTILDIAAAGVGAVTIGFLIFTRWSGGNDTHRRVSVSGSPGVGGYTGLSLNGTF